MDPLYSKLIGELIGIARATDGSEHLITPKVTSLLRQCLAAQNADPVYYNQLIAKADSIKREMVPDCYLCANPCGRTSAYDLTEICREPDGIRVEKQQILHALLNAKESTPESSLYRGLIALGMECVTPEFLHCIALELS